MLKKILLTLAALIAIFLIFVATRPAHFVIARSAVIPAPAGEVFALVNDFHKWNDWSPWAKLDPNAKNSFDGPAAGVGAKFAWSGNSEVGEGSMKITDSRPDESIQIDLNFTKPMPANDLAVFTFKPDGNGTRVTWTMSGDNGFMGKLVACFFDCDRMAGGQFENGFENMTAIVAGAPKP